MPIKVPNNLPALEILNNENIFAMDSERAFHQDIRPLKIVILNLMPNKLDTEVQILRLLGNSPLQIDVNLLYMESHVSKNTSHHYLSTFYNVFDDIKHRKFDGMIITGAPVETLEFKDVTYWDELTKIMDWTLTNVTSTFHICWGAQAALYYHYGVSKYPLDKKLFGVFQHERVYRHIDLLRGFDDVFYVPHSRHTEIRKEDIKKVNELQILSESDEAGVYIVSSKDYKHFFITGHSEYDKYSLDKEYKRDKAKGLDIALPKNYYKNDNPDNEPYTNWKSHSNLLYINWLNYYVYQITPYDL